MPISTERETDRRRVTAVIQNRLVEGAVKFPSCRLLQMVSGLRHDGAGFTDRPDVTEEEFTFAHKHSEKTRCVIWGINWFEVVVERRALGILGKLLSINPENPLHPLVDRQRSTDCPQQ
ncbi:unnamed protein product [Pleuronectes platessa]|uniref:Uncharacterized protein n=1 Tax=Pleuronectes platessa TaxID=8262 RepID=A0A9N7W4C6_PLEPL|nr:unnamed protein product [Pleuronectes platessa]